MCVYLGIAQTTGRGNSIHSLVDGVIEGVKIPMWWDTAAFGLFLAGKLLAT